MKKSGVSGEEKRGKTNEGKQSSEGFLGGVICAGNKGTVRGAFAWSDSFRLLYLRVLFVRNCRSRSQ